MQPQIDNTWTKYIRRSREWEASAENLRRLQEVQITMPRLSETDSQSSLHSLEDAYRVYQESRSALNEAFDRVITTQAEVT